ncbi:conserved Plasmodium protein, unknown function [Plasmodium reichenowi]|uniref:CRA domain-containing protein n=1 Tax=Plasmodium reichenowi TaxID=5854 RepID=A0A060RRK1_PLARE|nr:conserved Plasmodium protein, unknown function [Plasmodium reichenowi]SOV78640.1 conserved Plasmodium protein, unknown function [Plasmodium reichenowi]
MKNKLSTLFFITIFLILIFIDSAKGDERKNFWKSRFTAGRGNITNKPTEVNHPIKKEGENFLSVGKGDNDESRVMLLKELYQKDNELNIVRKKHKKYKSITVALASIIGMMLLRNIGSLLYDTVTRLNQKSNRVWML